MKLRQSSEIRRRLSRQRREYLDAEIKRLCDGLSDDKSSEGSMYLVVIRTWVWLASRGQVVMAHRKLKKIV